MKQRTYFLHEVELFSQTINFFFYNIWTELFVEKIQNFPDVHYDANILSLDLKDVLENWGLKIHFPETLKTESFRKIVNIEYEKKQ